VERFLGVFLLAMVAVSILTVSVIARPHHRHHHHYIRHHARAAPVEVAPERPAFSFWFVGVSPDIVSTARSYLGAGAVFGRSTLWCATFVNHVLKKTGRAGTNSDAAFSFARWGHSTSTPQPGAIAVMGRRGGGHVGVVTGVDSAGNPIIISGNHNGRVREAVYPRQRIITYRIAQ
jgi:uncharacterized protein (TIGR02594 family)